MKEWIKKWLKKVSPFALSKNHGYDILTKKILVKYCVVGSNCIDVGCHKGEILDIFLQIAPKGEHYAFEPIPSLFENLVKKYAHFKNCHIYNYAISNSDEQTSFNHVISNPAYSGIKKRTYDRKEEKDETITVTKKRLDDIIPQDLKIDFIKIDVEGGDLDVMLGAKNLIKRNKTLIVFEFGVGGSDIYGASPEALYDFAKETGYKISLLDSFLKHKEALTLNEFNEQFHKKTNYYFIAHPE
jgi:FkbM family methyltransferase